MLGDVISIGFSFPSGYKKHLSTSVHDLSKNGFNFSAYFKGALRRQVMRVEVEWASVRGYECAGLFQKRFGKIKNRYLAPLVSCEHCMNCSVPRDVFLPGRSPRRRTPEHRMDGKLFWDIELMLGSRLHEPDLSHPGRDQSRDGRAQRFLKYQLFCP
jgi:hypothetical protein